MHNTVSHFRKVQCSSCEFRMHNRSFQNAYYSIRRKRSFSGCPPNVWYVLLIHISKLATLHIKEKTEYRAGLPPPRFFSATITLIFCCPQFVEISDLFLRKRNEDDDHASYFPPLSCGFHCLCPTWSRGWNLQMLSLCSPVMVSSSSRRKSCKSSESDLTLFRWYSFQLFVQHQRESEHHKYG